MSQIINFPVPIAREMVVVKLFGAAKRGRYILVINDPEIGEMQPSKNLTRKEALEMMAALSDDAGRRDFDFEVHEHSEKTLFTRDNDNG